MRRRATPIPAADENPLLMTLRTKTYVARKVLKWSSLLLRSFYFLLGSEFLFGPEHLCSTPEGVQYTEGCSVHCRDIMSTVEVVQYTEGNTMATLEGYHDECEGYHEYTGRCSIHWGFYKNSFVFPMTFPYIYHDLPQIYS